MGPRWLPSGTPEGIKFLVLSMFSLDSIGSGYIAGIWVPSQIVDEKAID